MAGINRFARKIIPQDLIDRVDMVRKTAAVGEDEDAFGFDADYLEAVLPAMLLAYRVWFRVKVFGIENVPDEGPVLLVANHSGQVPVDGMVITTAALVEMEPPRLVRSMVDYWVPGLPFVNVLFARMGQTVGVWENARRLLEHGQPLLVFPEGTRGLGKTWEKRYHLQDFTVGFMELAINYNAPVVPIAVVGGEEQMPSLYNARPLAKLFKAPYFPITPTFPLLGLRGAIPYPVNYEIHFGEPMDFSDHRDDLENPRKVREHVEAVRKKLQDMLDEKKKTHPIASLFLPPGEE